jgi:hypothetical protein
MIDNSRLVSRQVKIQIGGIEMAGDNISGAIVDQGIDTANELIDCERELSPLVTNTSFNLKCTVGEVGGVDPASIIHTDQDWYVDVEWEVRGQLVRHLCGTWHVSVTLESIGPGDEYEFPKSAPAQVEMDPCGDGKYNHRIEVARGEVDARDPSGTVYIVAVELGSTDPCGRPGHIYAHCTGEELQFVPGPAHTP